MKIEFSTLLKKIRNIAHDRSSGLVVHRGRDWKLLASFLAVVTLATLCFDGYLYLKIKSDISQSVDANTAESVSTLDIKTLDDVVNSFQDKAQNFLQYQTVKPKLADPAL